MPGYYNPWVDAAQSFGGAGNDISRLMLGIAKVQAEQRQQQFQNQVTLKELGQRDQSFGLQRDEAAARIPLYQSEAKAHDASTQDMFAKIAQLQMETDAAQKFGSAQARLQVPADPILQGNGPTLAGGVQLNQRDSTQNLMQLIAMHNPEALIALHNTPENQVGSDAMGRQQFGPTVLRPGESYQRDPNGPQTLNTNFAPRATGQENDVALINGLTHFLGQATQMDQFGDAPLHPELQASEAYTNALPLLGSLIQGQQQRVQTKYGQTNAPTAAPKVAPTKTAKPLDKATAAQLLQQAGGDKNKARQLATQAGYTF